jgi:hypothetical protein
MDQTQLQAFVKSAVAKMENANLSGNPYQLVVSTAPLATSKSPTFGHPKSPRQDG